MSMPHAVHETDTVRETGGASPASPVHNAKDYLAELNREQRAAVVHGVRSSTPADLDPITPADQGPLLIIAGAGSGKTNTLAYRVAHLVVSGADPQRILLLTFSRRAAAAMERRAGQILQRVLGATSRQPPPPIPWSGTFHGVGARLLREYAERIGLHPSFTIHDRGDSEDSMAIVRFDLGLSSTKSRFPTKSTCVAIYSRAVNSEDPLADVLKSEFPWCAQWEAALKSLFAAYIDAKQSQHVLDYDDLLLYWAQMVAEPRLGREIGERFDHVLVDEYQDTNRLQASILRAMKPDGRNVTVVGDDAQSIYSFRAATVRNILDFPAQFSPPAKVVTLDRNYRSTQPILDSCNAVIALATERFTKNLWTERKSSHKPQLITIRDEGHQAECVAERVLLHRENGMTLRSHAVLFRSSGHSAQLELELNRRNIPFVKYGGLKFLEAAHIKDVLAVLRWAENPRSRMAGYRAARLVQGIGAATTVKLQDAMDAAADPAAALQAFVVPAAASADWRAFVALFQALHCARPDWPVDMDLITRWYEPQLSRLYDDAPVRLGDLVQLRQIATTYPSRERFLTEMTLDPPAATSDEAGAPLKDDDYLTLSTIHSAKGQEWKAVYVLNVVDGCIPSDMSTGTGEGIDEERRLLYVAMTRARDHLHLLVPQRFYVHSQGGHGDRHVYASRSRFIPDSLMAHFEIATWPVLDADDTTTAREEPRPYVDISARVKALWR